MVALFAVVTIVFFLGVDFVYQRVQKRKAQATVPQSIYAKANAISRIAVPEGLFFHPGHTWASLAESGIAKVGIDDFARKLFGTIDGIEFKKTTGEVKQGEPLFVIKQGNRTVEMVAPVDGYIKATNAKVAGDPSVLKSDTYQHGWLAAIQPTNLKKNLEKLNIADTAKAWVREEYARLRDFFAATTFENQLVGQTLQDGGPPVEGVLEFMSDEAMTKFEEEFLKK
jgi:glycine cleavage system H lipoate-binding protein